MSPNLKPLGRGITNGSESHCYCVPLFEFLLSWACICFSGLLGLGSFFSRKIMRLISHVILEFWYIFLFEKVNDCLQLHNNLIFLKTQQNINIFKVQTDCCTLDRYLKFHLVSTCMCYCPSAVKYYKAASEFKSQIARIRFVWPLSSLYICEINKQFKIYNMLVYLKNPSY